MRTTFAISVSPCPGPLIASWERVKQLLGTVLRMGPLGFASVEFYKEEMTDVQWSQQHLRVHLRRAELIDL